MSTTKVVDSMRDVTVVDAAKITTGAVPAAALTNVDLVEGTKGTDIVSAGTMIIGTDGGYFDITGTTGISTMTVAAGRVFTLQFDAAVTLTHSSTLYLSGAADFTTEANDHMTFISVAANDVRQIGTGLKDGGSPVVPASGVTAKWLLATHDLSVVETQSITGVGFEPAAMNWVMVKNATEGVFVGWGDGASSQFGGITNYHESTADQWYASNQVAFVYVGSAGMNSRISQVAFTSDGVDLTWIKSGSPTGTVNMFFLFLK